MAEASTSSGMVSPNQNGDVDDDEDDGEKLRSSTEWLHLAKPDGRERCHALIQRVEDGEPEEQVADPSDDDDRGEGGSGEPNPAPIVHCFIIPRSAGPARLRR